MQETGKGGVYPIVQFTPQIGSQYELTKVCGAGHTSEKRFLKIIVTHYYYRLTRIPGG